MIRSLFPLCKSVWASLGRALSVALVTLFTFVVYGGAAPAPHSLAVEVVKIYPSSGFWTGTIEANQWLDVVVIRSSTAAYKKGDLLHVGVAVIKGNKLFDLDTRSLDDHQIVNGRIMTIRTGGNCLKDSSSREFKVDPACIRLDGKVSKLPNSVTIK